MIRRCILNVDRTRAQQVGIAAARCGAEPAGLVERQFPDLADFWLNPKNGVSYNVAVQTPQYRVDSMQALMNTPMDAIERAGAASAGEPGDGRRRR